MKGNHRHDKYIWQRADWPDFKWDPEALLEPLAGICQLHGELNGKMSMLGLGDKDFALLSSLTDDIISSSEIEGVVLNPNSVKSSIARRLGVEIDVILAEDHYVEGLVDVMLDAIKNCSKPLTEDRIFGWHAALFPLGRSGMYKITVAHWREGTEPMQVVSGAFGHEKIHYEAPPSEVVAHEMAKLMDWVNNNNISPFIMSAIAHLWFVTIHPFDDGNGRLSRTLADMILSRADNTSGRYYSMSGEINRNKKEYYDILERTQKSSLDITEWILWFFSCLERSITHAQSVVGRTLRKSKYWNCHREKEINERQRKVINRLWDGFDGKLTSSKWAKICHCSQDTALRDISDLIAKGMLRKGEEGGRNVNYRLTDDQFP